MKYFNLGPECERPLETGRCRAYFIRYGFNTESGKCQQFVFGGCRSNGNNFKSLEECQRRCEN